MGVDLHPGGDARHHARQSGKYASDDVRLGHRARIGHEINQGEYAIAEITNNYFSQLSASKDSNASARWNWDELYEKVTSGTLGPSPSGAVQLGMYWQLHLAYDNAYSFTTYADYADQFNNLFFARVDAYARNNAIAPAPGGVALSPTGPTPTTRSCACRAPPAAKPAGVLRGMGHDLG